MIYLIDSNQPYFPTPNENHIQTHDGLIAVSHELNTKLLFAAYQQGIFPWYQDEQFFYWFTTHPRSILLPNNLTIQRSLAKTLRNKSYRVTVNHCFQEVIVNCAKTPRKKQTGTWIAPQFQAAYYQLYQLGHAHSFECWLPENNQWLLAGGLYGVQIGKVFYGESMFSHRPDASKIAFAHAVPYLQQAGIKLIDCQQESQHLNRFGAHTIAFHSFHALLKQLNPQTLNHPIQTSCIIENPPTS